MAFTQDEAAYLKLQPLARIAIVGSDGQPDVTPVSFEFDGTYFYLGGCSDRPGGRRLSGRGGYARARVQAGVGRDACRRRP